MKVRSLRVRRLASVTAAIAVTVLSMGTAANAATGLLPDPPKVPGPLQTQTSTLTCDLSRYGYTDQTSPVTVSVSVTASQKEIWMVPDIIRMSIAAAPLPKAVSDQLTDIDTVMMATSVIVARNDGQDVDLTSTAGTIPPGPLTEIPQFNNVTGPVTFINPGSEAVSTPRFVDFTPYSKGTARPVIPCEDYGELGDIVVSVADVPATGPRYTCTDTSDEYRGYSGHIPMTVSISGSKTVGATDTVWLTSPSDGLGAPYPAGTVSVRYSGGLTLSGAQSGLVPLSETIPKNAASGSPVSGKLVLSKAGTDHLSFPKKFTLVVSGGTSPIMDLACTASPASTALTFTVTKASGSQAPPTASPSPPGGAGSGSGGTEDGSAFPAGAPATGGGLAPSGLPLIGAALVLLLAGGGAIFVAFRRRKGQSA